MPESVPTGEQLVLLSKIAANVALSLAALSSGDDETDLRTTINLVRLARNGYICYALGQPVVRCTEFGRIWVYAHERHHTWRSVGRSH